LKLTQFCRAGLGRFSVRVSSEETWDTLSFLVNNNRVGRWSGEVGWIDFEFPVTGGMNTFEWRYAKDVANTAAGLDAAFIDNLDLPLAVPTDSTSPAKLFVERTSGGRFQLRAAGQADQTYVIERSEDLRIWAPVSTNVATSSVVRYVEPLSSAGAFRFYRAIVP
jgi:hypothetical protein